MPALPFPAQRVNVSVSSDEAGLPSNKENYEAPLSEQSRVTRQLLTLQFPRWWQAVALTTGNASRHGRFGIVKSVLDVVAEYHLYSPDSDSGRD